MTKTRYNYEADWRPYAFEEEPGGFATEEALQERYTKARLLRGQPLTAGGMPIRSDGTNVLLNTGDDHAIIYGGTASKKTRTLILPLISILAQAQESMVILDIKGELSDGIAFPQVRGILEENGYNCRFLNFRDMDCDGFNILAEAYRLYRSGQRDEGVRMAGDVVDALAAIYRDSRADPFWEKTGRMYLTSVLVLLFELCDDADRVNMLSLAGYNNFDACDELQKVCKLLDVDNNVMTMLRSVLSEPDKTRMSTLATVNTMLTPFLTNDKLLKMLSHSTFAVRELYEQPTALFLILPDEVDTFSSIVGLLLQQFAATLVRDAYTMGGRLPRRVNFVCDEFCNYYVPGMMRAISAHRSRNIRWYMVCQSQKQLEACYSKEAATITANCGNIFFLNSPELSLMEELSKRAGTTRITADGNPRPILSVADLQSLKKGRDLTDVYFTAGATHYVSKMPDILGYPFLSGLTHSIPMPHRKFPPTRVYTAERMYKDVRAIRYAHEAKMDGRPMDAAREALAAAYENLFSEDT